MMELPVHIELEGKEVLVGHIAGNESADACFRYDEIYLFSPSAKAISLNLPLSSTSFTPEATRAFFDGLLPEGFMRKAISESMHVPENDYLSVLAQLGAECLGAVKIGARETENGTSFYKPLDTQQMLALAREGATKSADIVSESHLSLAGASGKVGLYHDERRDKWFQPVGDAPSTHIVKQSHVRFESIVANEQLCLSAARKLGIETPDSFIVDVGKDENTRLLATKRYDRTFSRHCKILDDMPAPLRLHQEDFAQALGIPSDAKYESSGENYMDKMFDLLLKHSAFPVEDRFKLWDICVFNYLVGNTDNHIKNVSLLYDESLGSLALAPAYDIISTVIYERSSTDMAFNIAGKTSVSEIGRDSFSEQAKRIGLGARPAMSRFDEMRAGIKDALLKACEELEKQGFSETSRIAAEIVEKRGLK